MLINITTRGFEMTKSLKEFSENRVRMLLTRYAQNISRVDVTLLDINGPRGGEDKRCKIKVSLPGKQEVIVQDTNDDLYDSIFSCSNRVKRVVKRKLDKKNRIQFVPLQLGETQ